MNAMRTAMALLLVTALGANASAAPSTGSGRSTFRWVDDKGVVHYGDKIPAEYAKRERSVLNTQGVEVARLPAQRSPAQIEEDERIADIQRKKDQRDNFLLTTYQSVRDIEQLRDTRLQQLADQKRSTLFYIESLNSRLTQLQERAVIFKPYNDNANARPMPDQLAEDIVRTLNEQRAQRGVFESKRAEETELHRQFQVDIDRYRQLRSAIKVTAQP
jgi:Domain of unknown function (DUF4124)